MVKGLWLTCTWKYEIKPEVAAQAGLWSAHSNSEHSLHLKRCKKVQKVTDSDPGYWLCCSSFMLTDQHVGNINPNSESSVCKIKSSGDAGLTHHFTEHLSFSCWESWGKDKYRLLWWPWEDSGHWHKAKMLCVFSAVLGAVSEQPGGDTAKGRWAQAGLCPESIPESEFFSLVQGICKHLVLSTQECENANNWLCPSTMGELTLRN